MLTVALLHLLLLATTSTVLAAVPLAASGLQATKVYHINITTAKTVQMLCSNRNGRLMIFTEMTIHLKGIAK